MNEKHTSDGTPIEGHAYRVHERHTRCVVEVLKCERCGKFSVGWYPEDQPPPKWVDPVPGDTIQASKP